MLKDTDGTVLCWRGDRIIKKCFVLALGKPGRLSFETIQTVCGEEIHVYIYIDIYIYIYIDRYTFTCVICHIYVCHMTHSYV